MRSTATRLLLALQAAVLIVLTPLASATPVDPPWIPGIYDDGDLDDVITIVVDDGLVGPPPGRAIDGFVPTTQRRTGRLRGTLGWDHLRVDTRRLRSPPNS